MQNRLFYTIILPAMAYTFCSCVSSSVVLPEPVIPADFAGFVHAGNSNKEEEYALLDYLGANWILHTFNWDRIEREQGTWDFQYYDDIVDKAAAVGIKTLGILAYDNGWIHPNGKKRFYIPPERIPDFLEYVRQTATHFKGRIGAWSIWNEPNSFFWAGTMKEFFELAKQTADAVREVDSDVILLGGGFNRGIFGLSKKYIRGIFESGAMEKTDGIAFHPYELNPARTARLYDHFKKTVDHYDFGDKIWVTEAGYPTGGWYPTKVSSKKFPAYVVKTYTLLAVRGAQKLLWYQLFDPVTRKKSDSEDFFGLVRSREDFTSKGAEAFRLCTTYLSGTTCYAQHPVLEGLPGGLTAFYFEGENVSTLIFWNNGLGSKKVRLRLNGTDFVMHDPVSGSTSAVSSETVVKATSMPVIITGSFTAK